MKRALGLILLLTAMVAVFVWQLPASVIAGFIPVEANRFLQVHRVTGTIWHGNALFATAGVPPTLSVSWQCQPSIAPFGASCTLSGSVTGTLRANAFSSTLGAEKLAATLPVQVNVANGAAAAASPRVALSVESMTLSATSLVITGSVRANDARYAFGQAPIALGEITTDCKPDASAVASTCSISNRGGSARLDGQISLSARKLAGSVELVAPGTPAQRVTF